MILTKTNVAKTATITMQNADPNQDPSVLVNGDFSSIYSATLSGSVSIQLDFPMQDLGYIAIGGSNIAKKVSADVLYGDTSDFSNLRESSSLQLVTSDNLNLRVQDFYTDSYPLGYADSEVLVFKIDARTDRVTITINGTGQIGIADIAMGQYYTVPNGGEQSGYARAWSVPNVQSRTATGLDTSPVALMYEGRPLKCTLNIPHMVMKDYDEYYDFLRFATLNTFYILEDDNPTHSYAAFNAMPDMTKAHSVTRSLGSASLKFSAYSKTREGLLL